MNTNKIKQIQSLKHQKYREKYGQFIIEGKRLIQSALESEIKISLIFYTDIFFDSNKPWFKSINELNLTNVSQNIFQKISTTKSPSGIGAICELPKYKIPNIKNDHWVYLDKVSDPGNMGSLIRSAEWFGLNCIALSPGCVDPYNPKVLRSGMGAHFNVEIHNNISLDEFFNTHLIIAGDIKGEDISKFEFPKKSVVVLGNEAHGHSNQNQQYITNYVTINKIGAGESLNVSAAGAIIFHHLTLNK